MPPAAKSSKHALKKPKVLEATCLADVGVTLQAIEEDVKRHQASIQQQLQKSTLAMMTSSSSSPQQSTSNNNNTTTANGGSPSANGAVTGLSSSPQSVPRRSSMAHGDGGITNTDNHAPPSTTLLMKAGGSAATQEARKALKKQLVATAAKRLGVQRTRGKSVAADPSDNNTTDHSLYAEADDETGEGEEDPQQQDVLKKIAHLPVFARVHADAPVTAVDRDRVEALVGGAALQRDHQRPNRAHRYVASGNDVSNAAKEALMELLLNPVVDPASSMNSEDPASITTANSAAAQQAKLRHPHLVSAHDYISTQLAALRFSVANGQRYHELFDLHAGAAAQQKSSSRTTHPNNNGNHQVDFIAENCRAVREQGPSTMCAEAYREHRLRLGRNQVTNTELSEWIHEQLESKRELMLLAAHSATTGTADLGDDSNNTPATLPPDSLNGTLNPGSSIVLASSPTANKNSPRNHSSNSSMVQSERDIANLSKRQWLALVAGGVRAAVFVKAAEALYQARVSNAIAKDLQRRRPPEQPPLVYLDLLRGKHDLVRRTLRKFIQNRLRAKHRHHVDLIIRYLKFRLLQQTITRRVQWYRRCVITCQRQVLTFLQMIRARKLLLHLQWIKKECALLKVPNKSVDELRSQWSEQKRTIDPALLCGTRLLQTGGGGGGSPTQHQGGRSPMSRDGRGRTPKTGAAAVAQHGGYMHVNQWRPPLLKPGVPPCVVWSTRMTWVPPGGTPYEARCSSIQTLCTSLVKQHAADLRSAEGTLRFFRKQWSRYEAEGLGALGLPAPRPPQTPLFRLLVPSNSLHVHVRVSLKERAPNQGNVFGMGAGAAGGVTPTLAALHPPTAAASPSSHPNNNNTNNNNSSNNAGQARGGGPTTTATTIGSASKGGGSTTADQNMANPSSSFAIPSGAATTTAGGAGGKKGAAAAAAGPSKGGNHANSNARKSPPQASKRTASTASKQAAAAPAGHTVPRPPPLPSESSSAPPGAATFQPTGPSSGTAQTASGSNAAAFGSAAAVLQYAAKFRRKSDRRASASSPPGATDQNGESLVVSSEQASSTNSPSRRRSVHRSSVYGNDEILDRALQKVGPREEGTLLSPDAYAVILGKPSVAAMRSFVDDRVITSSDGPRPPLLKKQQRGASPISSSRDPNHIGMAKEEQALDGSSPLLHMKLKSLNQHYTQTALREQADLYHCPAHPKTLLASALDHDDDLQLQVAFPTTSSVAPRHFHRDQTTQKLSTCAVVSGVPVAVAELTSPQRLTALHNAMSLSPVTATTAAGGGGVGLMVMKSPSTHQPSAPTVSGTTTTGFVGLAHSPRRKLLAASTGAGHHASSSGAAVVKLRPHVANDKPMLPSLDVTPHAETARSGARGGWELPPETDLVHDAQLAVAFAGSSEAQRRLMRSGVTIPQPRKVLPLPSSTAAAQTSRVPAIGAVELLEAMDESRRRHASNLQARRML